MRSAPARNPGQAGSLAWDLQSGTRRRPGRTVGSGRSLVVGFEFALPSGGILDP